MKIHGWITIIFLFIISNAVAENEALRMWQKKKEMLGRDPSVIAYYTFEDIADSQSAAKDLSGRGGDLIFTPVKAGKKVIDDLKVIEGRFPGKKAVRLDKGYYRGPVIDIENRSFTAECWFRRSGPATVYEDMTEGSTTTILLAGGGAKGWTLYYAPKSSPSTLNAHVSCVPGTTSDGRQRSSLRASGGDCTPGRWHHAAFTWDGKEIVAYLNGTMIGRRQHDGQYVPAGSGLMVGYNTSEIIDIDEVVIYNRVLTPEEIKETGEGKEGLAADSIRTIFAEADRLIEKKDFSGARKEYTKIRDITGIDYAESLILFNEAESYRLEGRYEEAHSAYDKILKLPGMNANGRAYTLFSKARLYREEGKYPEERHAYSEIQGIEGISENDRMRADRGMGDTYRSEKQYVKARGVYEKLLKEVSSKYNPNEIHRLELADRLESIDGLADGQLEIPERQKRIERVNLPEYGIYVSVSGSDAGKGTKESPFSTIGRAQEEVRRIKKEKGLPEKGISVYLRGGEYFVEDTVVFSDEDSGTEGAPVVYRSFPGENARIIGGRKVSGFSPLKDPEILSRLPDESKKNVWVADLKGQGITEYGQLMNRGTWTGRPGAMELIFNGRVMELARWPNEGWQKVASLVNPGGDGIVRNTPFQVGKFVYSGTRPERWKDEKEIWLKGYMGVRQPYILKHWKVSEINTGKKIIYLEEGPKKNIETPRIAADHPYFAYNLLSEIDRPGEWYLDRENGKLYFWPPSTPGEGEIIVTTLNKPLLELRETSNMVLFSLTLEGTWQNAIEVTEGENNLIAGCTVRNTGQWGILLLSGWEHCVAGCDIYDVGEGGISIAKGMNYNLRNTSAADFRRKLVPNNMIVENNFIYRFNRFCGGNNPAIAVNGIGQRISHNLIFDSPHYGISISHNNNIIEFNEIHDVLAHSRELGAIYTYDGGNQLTYRGNILRYNFIHHVTGHYSPNTTHGVRAVHIDGVSSNFTISGNIFYRTQGISSSAPDCRFENNIFVNCSPGISQGNRSNILGTAEKLENWGKEAVKALSRVDYRMPPWGTRYPQLENFLEPEKRPLGLPRNITIERNLNTEGNFLTLAGGIRANLKIENNMTENDPLFFDRDNIDFRIRPGSPVYRQIGFEPISSENTGLYRDELRASWPVKRQVGKYFDPSKESAGESKSMEYEVKRRSGDIKIDGMLEKEEWQGLDIKNAILVDTYYSASQDKKGPQSRIWISYDDDYLYIGMDHGNDPWTIDMPANLKEIPSFRGKTEISIEGDAANWWPLDMETGPIYVMNIYSDGQLELLNSHFKLPEDLREKLEKNITCRAIMHDLSMLRWTAECRIPLSLLNINPMETSSRRFNIGVRKRKDWMGWTYTGGSIWRLEGGGKINFSRQ